MVQPHTFLKAGPSVFADGWCLGGRRKRSQRGLQCCVLFYSGTVGVTEQLKEWSFHLFHSSHCSGLFTQIIYYLQFNPTLQAREQSHENPTRSCLSPAPSASHTVAPPSPWAIGFTFMKDSACARHSARPSYINFSPYHPQKNAPSEYCYCSKTPSCPCRGTSTSQYHLPAPLFTSLFQTS